MAQYQGTINPFMIALSLSAWVFSDVVAVQYGSQRAVVSPLGSASESVHGADVDTGAYNRTCPLQPEGTEPPKVEVIIVTTCH